MATGRTATERALEVLGAVGMAVFVGYAFVVWPKLLARVPTTHFVLPGPPDRWAGKGALAILPTVAVIAYFIITIVQRLPRVYNFPVPVTSANAERLYALARRLMTSVKLTFGRRMTSMASSTAALALATLTFATSIAASAADIPPPTPEQPAEESAPPPPTPEQPAEESAPPPQPPPPPPIVRRYADRGTSEVAVGLGYSSFAGFLAAGGFRYFVLDGLAPGVEGTWVAGGSQISSYGLALASLRAVPLRGPYAAVVLTARGGRVFLSDHADGWGAGGGAGVIIPLGGLTGVELGYQALRLLPASFCADLSTCWLHGLVIGLRFGF